MTSQKFEVTHSLISRLKAFMIAIALFFIAGAIGVYISSLSFFEGVQQINSANVLLSLTNQSVESLDSSDLNIGKILEINDLKDIKFNFLASQEILKETIRKSIVASGENEQIRKLLEQALDSVFRYDQLTQTVFKKIELDKKPLSKTDLEEIKSEILVALQYSMDAKEFLRKSQIHLKTDSDELFSNIYDNRFRPLFVAVSLSALFFLFVITIGFSIAAKIKMSVTNLLSATDKVSEGDFTHQATIFDQDEFGHLTATFNNMVMSLREGRSELDTTIKRIQRLQSITAKFSQALTVDEVMDVTIHEGYKLLDVHAGAIYIYQNDTQEIELMRSSGFTQDRKERWKKYSTKIKTPATQAFNSRKPVFIENTQDSSYEYPLLEYEHNTHRTYSLAALPILIGETCMGVLILDYARPKKFSEAEKEFLMAMGRQCAQALHRSLLYDDSRKAIHVRDEFLSIASHELKTPLTPLKLQLQLLSKQLREHTANLSPEKIMKIMDNSDKQLNRLSRLIEDLLDVSRITSGKFKLNLQKTDLSLVISDVLVQYGNQLEASQNELNVHVDHDIFCQVDQIRIEQVLVNLLMNAVKYAPGMPVDITLKRHGNMARICISDQGPGISKEHQERIFKRFERITTNDNVGGLGLGLYISQQIIEAHRGRIFVESELNKGSSFIIDLPII